MSSRNPVVDEVRAIRDELARRYDYDVRKLACAMQAAEVESGRTFLRLAPRQAEPDRKAS